MYYKLSFIGDEDSSWSMTRGGFHNLGDIIDTFIRLTKPRGMPDYPRLSYWWCKSDSPTAKLTMHEMDELWAPLESIEFNICRHKISSDGFDVGFCIEYKLPCDIFPTRREIESAEDIYIALSGCIESAISELFKEESIT